MKNTWDSSSSDSLVFHNVIEQVADHVMVTDKQGFIEYVNPAFEKTTGYSKEEVLGKNPRILQSGKQSIEYYQALWGTILAGNVFYARTINKKKNGQLYVADQTVSPIFNEAKEIIRFVSIWKDVTEIVRIEERLKFEKEKLEEIVGLDGKLSRIRKSDQLMQFVVEKTRKILGVEKCSVMLFDRETNKLGTKAMEGFAEDSPLWVETAGSIAEQVILEGQALLVTDVEMDGRHKDLKLNFNLGRSFMIAPIPLVQDVIGVICVSGKHFNSKEELFDEVDLKILCAIAKEMAVAIENVSFYKELHYLTVVDHLTHMHNYRHFVNSLDYEFKRLKYFSGNLCVLMIDIDGFKSYNDQLSHLAGDELLKDIGQMIHLILREVDVLCRYGGDEFAVILPGINIDEAVGVAEKIRKLIENAKFKKNVTVSIGVAQYRDNMTRREITFKADKALYQAKDRGKNRVCVFGQD